MTATAVATPAPAPAADTVPAGPVFARVERPTVSRTVEPKANPYTVIVTELASELKGDVKASGAAQFAMQGEPASKDVGKQIRLLTAAGETIEPKVTVRKIIKADGANTVVTFWVTPKIVHNKPKAAEGAPATEAAPAAPAA